VSPLRARRRTRLLAVVVNLVALLALAPATGCVALNPARHVRATGERLSVDERGFRQGDEALDEQDFYALVGDDEAVRRIRARRRALLGDQFAGQAMGAAGVGAALVGAAAMTGGIVWTAEQGAPGLLLLLPGVFVLFGGMVVAPLGYVWADDAADAMDDRVLPVSRARHALERSRRRRR
jgi:hypothetical protein